MDNYKLLQAVYTINKKTKFLKNKLPKEENEIYNKILKEMNYLYTIKQRGIYYIMYFFNHEIDIHRYNDNSYWLLSLSGFEFHLPYVKIPNMDCNEKVKVKHLSYEKMGEISVTESIMIINKFVLLMKDNIKFQDYVKKFEYTMKNRIRPLIH